MAQTLDQIAKLPVELETQSDDGAYEEAHIESCIENKICKELFTKTQMQCMAGLVPDHETIKDIYIQDYTYFSTGGSVFCRIQVTLNFDSGRNRCIYNGNKCGRVVSFNSEGLEYGTLDLSTTT
jgi:hypothetical protein